MIPLTPAEMQAMQAALLDAFPNATSYAPLFLFATGSPIAAVIAVGAPLQTLVFDAIMWLEANGKTGDFLKKARETNPGNGKLREFEKSYFQTRRSSPPPAPLAPQLRSDLVSSLAAVPTLYVRLERDRILGPWNTPSLNRSDHDVRADLELLADQVPAEGLARLAEGAAKTVAKLSPALADRLRGIAIALRSEFCESAPAESLSAQLPGSPEALLFEGVDERKGRSFLLMAATTGRSVARLAVPRYFDGMPDGVEGKGTGWLIGADLMITNHHVVEARDRRFESSAKPADFARQGGEVRVWFDYFEDGAPKIEARSAGLVASDEGLDFAIFRIASLPDRAQRPPLQLLPARPALRASDRLNIVQHASGQTQTYAIRNNFFVEGDGARLRYLTDTEAGASGSPVLTDAWRVVALHHAASPIAPKPVATLDLAAPSVVRFYNEGIFIDAILEWLENNAPAVHAKIVQPAETRAATG